MSFVVQMGLNEAETKVPKNNWSQRGIKNNIYGNYGKKNPTPRKPKTKNTTPKAPKSTTPRQPRAKYGSKTERKPKQTYTKKAYFPQYNSFSSDVSLVTHKARLIGSCPRLAKPTDPPEPPTTYFKPKFDKMIDPIIKSSRLDHCYFIGSYDLPPPPPPPTYTISPELNSVNGLSSKLHRPSSLASKPPSSVNPLLPILHQIPNKGLFGIARAGSPTKSLPLSSSYLVPQYPIIPPITHPLQLSPRLPPQVPSIKAETLHPHSLGRHSESSCDEERELDPQGEETETAPENGEEEDEDVSPSKEKDKKDDKQEPPVDDSVTRCICGFLHDDGYMICCDRCLVWQHVDCMEIDGANIPEEYLCEECQPRRVDKLRAVDLQMVRMDRFRKKARMDSDGNSDSSHSSIERSRNRGTTGKRKSSVGSMKPKRTKKIANPNTTNRRRKSSVKNDSKLVTATSQGSNIINSTNTPNSVIATPLTNKNKKANVSNTTPSGTTHLNSILHSNNKRKMITVAEKKQNHTEKNKNKVLSPLNHKLNLDKVNEKLGEKKNQNTPKRAPKKPQEKKIMNNTNHKRKSASLLLPTNDTKLLKNDIALKKEVSPIIAHDSSSSDDESKPMTRWIDNYEEATRNYYATDLRTRVENIKLNGSHNDVKLPSPLLSSAQKCRASLLSSGTKILVTSCPMNVNQPLVEMRGKYLLVSQDSKNIPSPGSHVFFYSMVSEGIDIMIDCRTYGNDARFVRRSCRPNAMMKHCIDRGDIYIYLTALTSITKNSEITVNYSTGGNPDLCTCGNKETCIAGIQKSKMYSERRLTIADPITPTIETKPISLPNLEIKTSPPSSPLLSTNSLVSPIQKSNTNVPAAKAVVPAPSLEKTTTMLEEDTLMKEIKVEEKSKDEKPTEIKTITTSTRKREKSESKTSIIVPTEEKVNIEEKTTLSSETSSNETKKVLENDKKPSPKLQQRRKKSVSIRKVSESSQSMESEDNTENDSEDKEKVRQVSTRRSSTSTSKSNTPLKKDVQPPTSSTTPSNTPTKLSREDRKLDAILKRIESMEKLANRKSEGRTRKDSTSIVIEKSEDSVPKLNKNLPSPQKSNKKVVRRRKGRSKSFSSTSTSTRTRRAAQRERQSQSKDETSSEDDEVDGNDSSDAAQPEKNVQATTPSFKLPFSKKSPEHPVDSNQDPESPEKPAGGCAKKRWLRQAISEECDSPRPDSPNNPFGEQAGPLKKRRLARASLSSDDKSFTPPTTPTLPDEDTSTPPHEAPQPSRHKRVISPNSAYACLNSTNNSDNFNGPINRIDNQHQITKLNKPVQNISLNNVDQVISPLLTDSSIPLPNNCSLNNVPAPLTLNTPQALETSLQNSHDFNMRSSSSNFDFQPTSTFSSINVNLPPNTSQAWTSPELIFNNEEPNLNITAFGLRTIHSPALCVRNRFRIPPTSLVPAPPLPSEPERLITKRKLSISEYRQRKGTALSSPSPVTRDCPSIRSNTARSSLDGISPVKKHRPGSPPTSSTDSSDDEGHITSRVIKKSVAVDDVIEKSVMVDDILAKISKSADSLQENKEFKDKLFRIPKSMNNNASSNVNNNNNQSKNCKLLPGLAPLPPSTQEHVDTFLNGPKENLTERLNRQFNIKITDDPPVLPPIAIPNKSISIPDLPPISGLPPMDSNISLDTDYPEINTDNLIAIGPYKSRTSSKCLPK